MDLQLFTALWQADLIPASVWTQYPVILLFLVTGAVAGRAILKEMDKLREERFRLIDILREERKQSIEDQRRQQEIMLQIFKETLERFERSHMAIFEQATERMNDSFFNVATQFMQQKDIRPAGVKTRRTD
jgi:hypothetical protein